MTERTICNVAVKPNVWCGTPRIELKMKEVEKLKSEIKDGEEAERLSELNSELVDLQMKIRTFESTASVPYFLEEIVPGDLLVELLPSADINYIRAHLSPHQLYEYRQSIFFQAHGQQEEAFRL